MIATIKGTVLFSRENYLVIEAGGIGYRISVPNSVLNLFSPGEGASLYIHHHISENSQALYGFNTVDEQEFFELLLSISGIGPKVALGVLNAATLEEIREAVISDNPKILTNISGIGAKTASRIVLELKNKITVADVRPAGTKSIDVGSSANLDVYEALTRLGYNGVEARAALKMIPEGIKDPAKKLKEALKNLGRSSG